MISTFKDLRIGI